MARVYRAYHPQLDRYVAIKVLRSDLMEDEDFLARFQREARAVAALRHAHIVQVFDFGNSCLNLTSIFGILGVYDTRMSGAPCRSCRYCKKGLFNLCDQLMKSKVLGAFAEYILLPSPIVKQHVFCKPHGLSFEEAAFLEPLSCVVHGMSALKIRDGDRILIIGAGPIGLLHLLVARQRGARTMITGLEQDRLSSARKLGAHATVDPSDLGPALDDFSEGLGVDYLCECTGAVDVWERSVNYVRRGGTVILFGGCAAGTRACYDTYRLHYDALTLKGVFHYTPRDVKEASRLLLEGMDVSSLVSDRYPLRDVKTPFEKLSRGEGIKYAIVP